MAYKIIGPNSNSKCMDNVVHIREVFFIGALLCVSLIINIILSWYTLNATRQIRDDQSQILGLIGELEELQDLEELEMLEELVDHLDGTRLVRLNIKCTGGQLHE